MAKLSFGKENFVTLLPVFVNIWSQISWERLMIGIRFFYKSGAFEWTINWFHQIWNLLIFNFGDVDNDISCHVTLGNFQRWPQGKNCSLTYQYLIFSEKTKVTQFARLCRIMTCLSNTSPVSFKASICFFWLLV